MNDASFTIINKHPPARNPRGRLDCPAWAGADWLPAKQEEQRSEPPAKQEEQRSEPPA